MNVLILEDEVLSAEHTANLLHKYDRNIKVQTIESVSEAQNWFQNNPEPDLLMADIHLSDGLSLELFKKITIQSPVIFTTAFEQYAIDAFKFNSVDYLLKPFNQKDLNQALDKHKLFHRTTTYSIPQPSINGIKKKFKNRFLVKIGNNITFKSIDEIAYFYADDKLVYLVAEDGKNYIVDYRLENLEDLLDPEFFYRINRKFVVNISAIQRLKSLMNSRLQVFLKPHFEQEIYISKEKVAEFKAWIDQ